MIRVPFRIFMLTLSVHLAFVFVAEAGNWPQWRGPNGNSVSDETNLPVQWSETAGIAWKCPLAEGSSTPAIWGDAVFLTSQKDETMMVHRINKADGKIVWTHQRAHAGHAVPRERRSY